MLLLMTQLSLILCAAAHTPPAPVPLFRTFEVAITNDATKVENKFSGVWLNASFTGPPNSREASKPVQFWGFYDGGSTWRLRFMPSAVGPWKYSFSFSDGSLKGEGTFQCVAEGASPGVLKPWPANPHWFAYEGKKPVFIKSYYNKAGGSQRQYAGKWFDKNFYSKLAQRGYNHHMASGFLPVLPLTALWDGAPFSDRDAPKAINHTIYTDPASPDMSMSLDVWETLEGHLRILNKYDISVQFFQGFNAQGPGAGDIQWSSMSEETKRWWVAYVVARLAPFANVGGYQYAWESPGNNSATNVTDPAHCHVGSRCGDYQLATLLREMDPFGHGTTYEEENVTLVNHFDLPAWTFGSVEALGAGDARLCGDSHFHGPTNKSKSCNGGSTQNHHDVSLQGYRGKPVYMCEGHDLWRSWWQAEEPNVVRAAWAVTTAAASFTWSDLGHRPDDPYYSTQTLVTYPSAATAIDVLNKIMVEELPAFFRMVPADELVLRPAPALTFCLAEKGHQYIVYSDEGAPFSLNTAATDGVAGAVAGASLNLTWFDPVTGVATHGGDAVPRAPSVKLTPPSAGKHWVAMLLSAAAR
jgi:hypothetical protein